MIGQVADIVENDIGDGFEIGALAGAGEYADAKSGFGVSTHLDIVAIVTHHDNLFTA